MNLKDRIETAGAGKVMDVAGLKRFVASLGPTLDDVREYLAPAGKYPYGRRMIFVNDALECIVMNWKPRSPCAPHDHGPESQGVVLLLRGRSKHTVYKRVPGDLKDAGHTFHDAGDTLQVIPGMLHAMESVGDEDLVSLHFYSPPIHNMKVFDLDKSQELTVTDDTGAWVPEEEDHIVDQKSL